MKVMNYQPINFDAPHVMNINNELVSEAPEMFDVVNPANGKVVATVPSATEEQLDQAVAAAKEAFKTWSRLSWDERADYLMKFADALDVHKEELATLLTREQGKPRATQALVEVDYAHDWIRSVAANEGLRMDPELVEENDDHYVEIHHVPMGVVGLITPWNWPYLLALWQVAPAILAGNTIVVKPSPYSPLTNLRFGEIAAQVFPKGVVNVMSGLNEFGAAMTAHEGISKISFTGSTETGRKIAAASADTLKRLTLELGGNDPAIILESADLDKVVPQVAMTTLTNCGQWCCGSKRLYVHSSLHQDFVEKFVAFAKTLKMGDGMEDNDLGPIQNKMQFDKIVDIMNDTKDNGYNIVMGGQIDMDQDGYFVPVTVVNNPPADSRIVMEEQFAPIVPIMSYDTIDEVIELANGTEYGLGSTVWGEDKDQAIYVANRLEAGSVWVNEGQTHGVLLPFGGVKQSGLGFSHGRDGMKSYCNTKSVMIKK